MKFYDITVKDLTEQEAAAVLLKLSTHQAVVDKSLAVHHMTPAGQPPLPPLNAGGDDDGSASANDVTGQFDKEGLPWDERIHSSNKKQTKDGVWVARRGVQPITRDAVVAELRGAGTQALTTQFAPSPGFQGGAPLTPQPQYQQPPAHPHAPTPGQYHPSQQAQPITPELIAANAGFPVQHQQPQPPAQPQYQQPPVQHAQPPVQHQQPAAGPTITDMFTRIQGACAGGTDEQNKAYLNSLTARVSQQFQVQVNSINDIAGRPEMIGFVMQLITNDGK